MQKVEVAAAILEKDFKTLSKRVAQARCIVDVLQVDVCDGDFVPSKTFGSSARASSFRKLAKLRSSTPKLELDMMVNLDSAIRGRFEKWLAAVKTAKPQRAVLHYGSTTRWSEVFATLQGASIEIGLGVHLHHSNADVTALLKKYPFKYVQVMGIKKVGFGGQGFAKEALNKIRALRKAFPKMPISVDGAVKVDNASALKKAGATRLASGSGMFKYKGGAQEAVRLLKR